MNNTKPFVGNEGPRTRRSSFLFYLSSFLYLKWKAETEQGIKSEVY
jgi:hypothetical protein